MYASFVNDVVHMPSYHCNAQVLINHALYQIQVNAQTLLILDILHPLLQLYNIVWFNAMQRQCQKYDLY